MKAGTLRQYITIQDRQLTQDPNTGAMVVSWVDLHTDVPADVQPLSAREFIAAQAAQSQTVARIVIRHRDGLTADMRILHRGKVYNPQGWLADRDSGLEYLTAPVTEGVTDGV